MKAAPHRRVFLSVAGTGIGKGNGMNDQDAEPGPGHRSIPLLDLAPAASLDCDDARALDRSLADEKA